MENALKKYIAAAVRAGRRSRSLTQEQLGELINRTPESISNIERAEALPSLDTLVLIGKVLGVSIDDLVGADAPPRQSRAHARLTEDVVATVRTLDVEQLEIAKLQLEALKLHKH